MKVLGKSIVVTGGGNSIGRQIVLRLLSKGAKVVAVDLSEKATRWSGFRIWHIDGYINGAVIIQAFVPIRDIEDQITEKVMRVNFYNT